MLLSKQERVKVAFSYVPIVLFLSVQVADGVLTYVAVSSFGLEAEGNPLLRKLIFLMGPHAALVAAKLTASFCGLVIYLVGGNSAIMWLTVLYVYVALLPWRVVLAGYF